MISYLLQSIEAFFFLGPSHLCCVKCNRICLGFWPHYARLFRVAVVSRHCSFKQREGQLWICKRQGGASGKDYVSSHLMMPLHVGP